MCSEKEVATEIPGVGVGSTHEIGLSDPGKASCLPTLPLKKEGKDGYTSRMVARDQIAGFIHPPGRKEDHRGCLPCWVSINVF